MQFIKSLKPLIKNGEVTTSIRIWKSQRVNERKRYRLDDGYIEVTAVKEISLQDITPEMARASGFSGLVDLLKTAKHGKGEKVFIVAFKYFGKLD